MKGSVKTVFPGNNSAEGFYSFYESGLSAMDHVYILKGGPGTGKSSFMRHLGEAFRDRGFDIELWQCSSDNDSLDGVLIPAYKTAVVDGTAPHTLDPVYPGAREEILNLGEFWKNNALRKEKDAIVSLTDRISAAFDDAYKKLKTAGEWDDRLLSCRKTDASQESGAESLVKELFGDETRSDRHLFAAAVTPEGMVDRTFEICRDVKKRCFLQGKRGLGQQSYLRTVMAAAQKRCISMDVYHGPIRPEEIVMVILPELDTVVAAAEVIPSSEMREGDRIISFHGDKVSEEEKRAEKERNAALADASAQIMKAHKLHDELEAFYTAAMDFESINRLEKIIFQKILKNIQNGKNL
ncbi:MAG: hypothetical protein ACI4QO_04570 [Clostridia bacterium]